MSTQPLHDNRPFNFPDELHRAERAISRLSISELADLIGNDGMAEPGGFWCPRCQMADRDRILLGPAATLDTQARFLEPIPVVAWKCGSCGEWGTRSSLARHILESPIFMERLALELLYPKGAA